MLNKVFLIGRLTRDPELKFLPSGTPVADLSIAYNRNYKVKDEWKQEAHFFDIVVFGQLAERVVKQLSKGTQILVEGELRQDRWETSEGDKRSKVKVLASRIVRISQTTENNEDEDKTEEDLNLPEDIEGLPDEDVPF